MPPNLKFLIDDAEDLWLYDEPFDFIHARLMAGCFTHWANFFRRAYQYTTRFTETYAVDVLIVIGTLSLAAG